MKRGSTFSRHLKLRPSANFAAVLFVLGAIWYAASSQNNAPAYLLLFSLIGILLVSIVHSIRNLSGLTITAGSVQPVFAGQEAILPLEIINPTRNARYGIVTDWDDGGEPGRIDVVAAEDAERLTLRFPASSRGEHELGKIRLTSIYPLGVYRVFKTVPIEQRYLVYPRPAGDERLPSSRVRSSQQPLHSDTREAADEFAGARPYILGESQRHIDWKAVARGQPLMTKQFASEQGGTLYLDFDQVRIPGVEARLSQLAMWIIEAERAGRAYGVRLPRVDIPPALGDTHFHRCLRQLALFP